MPIILSVTPFSEDHSLLRTLFAPSPWIVHETATCQDALLWTLLAESQPGAGVAIILCEARLPDGTWRDLFDALRFLAAPPPFVVTSRLADSHLWAEVLNLGAHDVLAKPLDAAEVSRVVTLVLGQPPSRKPPDSESVRRSVHQMSAPHSYWEGVAAGKIAS